MSQTVASWIVGAIGIYAAIGVLFAVPFVVAGVGRIDPSARGGSWGFRVLIVPGCAALWPLLALRLLRRRNAPPAECNAHRRAARAPEVAT